MSEKERVVSQFLNLKHRTEDVNKLFTQYRNYMVENHIPMDDDDFNTVEKFVANFIPMAISDMPLPKYPELRHPLDEKNFYSEAMVFVSDLEKASNYLHSTEEREEQRYGREQLKQKFNHMRRACTDIKRFLENSGILRRLGISAHESSHSPPSRCHSPYYYIAVVHIAAREASILHMKSLEL